MKIYVTPFFLKQLIFETINDSIELHRESKRNYFYFEHYDFAADQEIDDFIIVKKDFKKNLKKIWQYQKNKFIFALQNKIKNNKTCYAYNYILKR